jgi:hypothetical protein
MADTVETRLERAASGSADEIASLLHDPSPRVLRALLGNGNLTENDILIIAERKNLPADILQTIAKDKRWSESYPVRLALARNPHSPLSVSLSMARFLRIFDLEEITRSHFIPLVFRHKVEAMITERIPAMPLGNKKTLAKKAAGTILLKLLQDRDREVVQLCLNNPRLTEAHLFKVISRANTRAETIRMIAGHRNWSSRTSVRLSLVHNALTPLAFSVAFLQTMRTIDLRELHADPTVPVTIKPFIHRELWERGEETTARVEEKIFEIDEEEMTESEAELDAQEEREEGDGETDDGRE